MSSTQFKEHKTSGTLAVDLNSLPCDLIFKSDTNLFDIYELFRAGRHLLSNTTQALLLLLGAHLALHYLMLISALVYVPPVLNGIHLLWLLVVITPLLSLCLLWAPLEPKIMKQIAPKNLPIKTRRLFRYLGYFVARAIPSVLVCVVIYIWVLQLTWTTFDTRVIYGTELPVDFDWTNYFQALHFAQNVTLYAFVLYLGMCQLDLFIVLILGSGHLAHVSPSKSQSESRQSVHEQALGDRCAHHVCSFTCLIRKY